MPGKLSSCVSITAATSTIAEPVGWSAWPLFDFSGGPDRVTSKCYLASHVSHRCERNDDAPHIAFSLAIGMGYIPKLTVRVRFPSSAPPERPCRRHVPKSNRGRFQDHVTSNCYLMRSHPR